MRYPRYPAYKDSGVEWLGEVPAHWQVVPLKTCADFVNGAAFRPEDWTTEGVPIVRIENLNGGEEFNYFQGEIDPKYHLYKDDLVFGWSGNRGTSFGPFVWTREGLCYLNQHIFRVVSHGYNRRWLYWMLKAVTFYVEEQAHGIIGLVHITKGALGSIKVPKLSIEEQAAIAAFLDRETARLDALIARQEQLIALLHEKRQALIAHAVTKGLCPDTPMKDSGVAWLGEIPAHWQRLPLKRLVAVPVTDGPHETPEIVEDGVPFLSAESIKNNRLDFNRKRGYISPDLHQIYLRKCEPRRDDIFMVKSGNTTGNIAMVETDEVFSIWSPLALIRSDNKRILPRFTYYAMLSRPFQTNVSLSSSYGTQPNIGMGVIENLPIAFPASLTEQESIIRHLDQETSKIDEVITKAQIAIDYLNEHRTALIAAAVTGKIDVRDAVTAESATPLAAGGMA